MGTTTTVMILRRLQQTLTQSANDSRCLTEQEYNTISQDNITMTEYGSRDEKKAYFNALDVARRRYMRNTEQYNLLLVLSSNFLQLQEPVETPSFRRR